MIKRHYHYVVRRYEDTSYNQLTGIFSLKSWFADPIFCAERIQKDYAEENGYEREKIQLVRFVRV